MQKRWKRIRWWAALLSLFGAGCVGIPDGAEPVRPFDLSRYLGGWYEIARLDHAFERGLTDVTAQYSLRDDGTVQVINRGYDPKTQKWKQAEGTARFIGDPRTGRLKVSFFGPFYGAYNIIALDRTHYAWALVCGPDTDYLWILARSPKLDDGVVENLLNIARKAGFDTEKLIWVTHDNGADG